MSGEQAFLSFANYVKTALDGSGISVDIEKRDSLTAPYLILQPGPDMIRSKWLSSYMCQGWLVVHQNDTEPLVVTMGKALRKVFQATNDVGSIQKYDHEVSPKRAAGTVTPSVFEITPPMPSTDPKVQKRVITWELHSNAGS